MDSFHNGYFTDYLILKPDKVTLLGLIDLLYTGDIDKNSAVHCPEKTHNINELRRRWILFVSLFLQMILLKLRKPMAMFGWAVEKWMNLYYANGDSIFVLIRNFLSGKIIKVFLFISDFFFGKNMIENCRYLTMIEYNYKKKICIEHD